MYLTRKATTGPSITPFCPANQRLSMSRLIVVAHHHAVMVDSTIIIMVLSSSAAGADSEL